MTEAQRQALANTLAQVGEDIERLRQRRKRIGEQDTKGSLIDPVLSALGWNLRDPDEVSREYRRKPQDNPVDFALFLLRSPCLFIEAKALNTNLDDRKWAAQTISYAAVVGVEWCVLTNGDEYRLYNVHASVPVEEKQFRQVQISDAIKMEYTLDTLDLLSKDKMGENSLSVLWKAHFIDRRVKGVLDDLFRGLDRSLVALVRKRTDGLTRSEVEKSLKRADVRIDFPVASTLPEIPSVPAAPDKGGTQAPPKKPGKRTNTVIPGTLKDLIGADIIHPPLGIEVTYKKVRLTATIQQDGTVLFDGKTYTSLSNSGGMARNSVIGPPKDGRPFYQTNGWTFWRYWDDKTGKFKAIDHLRQRFLDLKK